MYCCRALRKFCASLRLSVCSTVWRESVWDCACGCVLLISCCNDLWLRLRARLLPYILSDWLMDPTANGLNGLQTGSDQVLNLLYGPYKLIASSKLIGLVPSLSVLVPIGISPPRVLVPIDVSPPRVLVPLDIPPPRSFIYTSQVSVLSISYA